MSNATIHGHHTQRTAHTQSVQPKKTEKPAPREAARSESGGQHENVSLSSPEGKKHAGQSRHLDALRGNFAFDAHDDHKDAQKPADSKQAADADKAGEGEKGKDTDKPKTPEQQKTDLNQKIQDLQGQIRDEQDPAKKKALEDELARLRGDLDKLNGGDKPQDGEKTGEVSGPGAAEGGSGVSGGGENPAARTPWRREQHDWNGGSQGAGGAQDGGGGPQGPGETSGPAPGQQPSGNVKEWVAQAMQILRNDGVDMSKVREQDIYLMIQKESGGNPHAQNNWDSNARKGTPSKGIMQCIDSTFNQYKSPGHGDIWNPVDNIVAAVKYAVSRYGSTANVPGVKSTSQGGAYRGY